MRKSLFLFALPMLAVALFIGCEGDEGPAGPKGDQGDQGIQGTQGAQGEQGAQGTQGIQGETGTANVIYSAWTTLSGGWRDTALSSNNIKVKHIVAAGVTADILNEGVVLCYHKKFYTLSGKYSLTYQLPMTGYSSDVAYTVDYILSPGKIFISCFTHDNTASFALSALAVNELFRYVIIPGGVAATAKKSTLDFTKLSYEEVCELFDIPE